jgi:pimeloyl-ACP methyl ester carboxylesterase
VPTTQIANTDIHIDGTGPETILMLHGWPDTAALWDFQVAAFSPHYRCVRFTWPGFEPGAPSKEHPLDDLIALCEQVVRETSPDQPVTLLLHDWGCLFGYQFAMRHPEMVARVIGVDIGDAGSSAHRAAIGIKGKLGTVAYQWWLALAWRIGGGIGEAMSRSMAKRLGVPLKPDQITVAKNYPYYSLWTGGYKQAKIFRPACPMLFIYGTNKPFMFHSPLWERKQGEQAGSRVVPMNTDHWPMERQPELFNATVLEWLAPASQPEDIHALPANL